MYPENHRKIVSLLLDGVFITADDLYYDTIKKNEDFYAGFFEQSFGYLLNGTVDFFFLVSPDTQENTSRDITIFFSILCYEMDKEGKNFLRELSYSLFSMEEILEYFKHSSWEEVIKANKQLSSEENIQRFMGTLVKRNIAIKEGNDQYSFSRAHRFFIDFVKEVIEEEE